MCVIGYVWGKPVDPLLRALWPLSDDVDADADADRDAPRASFDLILLSDLIFNHSQVRHPHFHFSVYLPLVHPLDN